MGLCNLHGLFFAVRIQEDNIAKLGTGLDIPGCNCPLRKSQPDQGRNERPSDRARCPWPQSFWPILESQFDASQSSSGVSVRDER